MMRIVFVSRELHPLGGGGIGVQVAGACAALVDVAEVTVVTSSALEPAYRDHVESGSEGIPHGVRLAFVQEPAPEEEGTYYGLPHLYSARVWEKLQQLYPDGGPDLIEFSDFMGEGLVTVQARCGRHPLLRATGICVRLHTTAEICSILNGHIGDDFGTRMVVAAERFVLRHADRVIAPSAAVLDTYARFYRGRTAAHAVAEPSSADRGAALAPAVTIAPIVPPDPDEPVAPPAAEALRFVYAGRLERRKGVQDLVRSFLDLRAESWKLTLVGGDTDTAPLAASMRGVLELTAAGDPRIEIVAARSRAGVRGLIDAHDVLIAPSRWECWPSAVLEGLGRNRPVVVTPTGGMPAMLAGGGAGWIAGGVGAEPLGELLEQLLAAPRLVAEAIASGAPRAAHDRLNDPRRLRESYRALAASIPAQPDRSPARRAQDGPLVSVVVPYFKLARFLEATLRSVFAQDHPALEAIVVNDGSLSREDSVLERLAERFPIRVLTKENGGLSSARNAGIAQARGRYVLPLDADNMLEPTFVSRCVELLEHEPEVAFVTTWSRYVDEHGEPLAGLKQGFQPIGNSSAAVMADNVAGDGTAVIRRELFDDGYRYSPDLASYEDWQLYRDLHRDGVFGRVIPERLLIYRLRADSMVHEVGFAHHHRLYDEMRALTRGEEMEWLCESVPMPAAL
jgi:glycogen synthase